MNFPQTTRWLAATALLAVCVLPAAAQTFPVKPVRAILPYSAGSGPDSVMRSVGEKLSRDWGQQLVVDNKPGANGWLAIGETKRAPADGYTLMTVDSTHMTLQQHLYKQLPFDPSRDFEPVAPLYRTNFFIVVGTNAPWKSVTELLAAAKVRTAS
jgi:tripartite-type tricarboxylate transporter receptor subunit TctC